MCFLSSSPPPRSLAPPPPPSLGWYFLDICSWQAQRLEPALHPLPGGRARDVGTEVGGEEGWRENGKQESGGEGRGGNSGESERRQYGSGQAGFSPSSVSGNWGGGGHWGPALWVTEPRWARTVEISSVFCFLFVHKIVSSDDKKSERRIRVGGRVESALFSP